MCTSPDSDRNSVLAECRADMGQGPGHAFQNVHTSNHQSPITNRRHYLISFERPNQNQDQKNLSLTQRKLLSRYGFTVCFECGHGMFHGRHREARNDDDELYL